MSRKVADEKKMRLLLAELARAVQTKLGLRNIALVGIKRRGACLAERLKTALQEKSSSEIPLGFLDIALYRDDFSSIGAHPVVSETDILFDITDRKVVLVDDVLYTGRTIRAALDALIDLGRPALIRLLVLVDRGHREFPISADFVGTCIKTGRNQMVEVHVKELDGKDEVLVVDRVKK